MKIYVATRYGTDGTIAEIELFSDREKAAEFLAGHCATWEVRTVKLDAKAQWRTRRYWWCKINLLTGRERTGGHRACYDFVPAGDTHTVKHSQRAVEVKSFISQEHANELARTEAAALKM